MHSLYPTYIANNTKKKRKTWLSNISRDNFRAPFFSHGFYTRRGGHKYWTDEKCVPAVCPSVRPSTRGELGAEIGGGGRGLAGGDRGRRLGFGTRGKNLQLGRHSQRLGGHVVLCFPRRRKRGLAGQHPCLQLWWNSRRTWNHPSRDLCLFACLHGLPFAAYLLSSLVSLVAALIRFHLPLTAFCFRRSQLPSTKKKKKKKTKVSAGLHGGAAVSSSREGGREGGRKEGRGSPFYFAQDSRLYDLFDW